MDINNLFSFFLEGDEEGEEIIITDDLTITPQYWLGMFKKLILNHINFNKKIVKFFTESNSELDVDDIKEAGESIVYNKAWGYIIKIDCENASHVEAIEQYSDEFLNTTLNLGLSYFQGEEEYEKCAHLFKTLNKS